MKTSGRFAAISVLGAIVLAGCCSCPPNPTQVGGNTNVVSLVDAMRSVGKGLAALKEAENGLKTGLLPDTVTITLNVAASAGKTEAGSAGLTVAAPTPVGVNVGANASGSFSNNQTSQVSNTITITFKNFLYAGGGTNVLPLLKDYASATNILTWIGNSQYVPMMTTQEKK
jgi:hypothetical protein